MLAPDGFTFIRFIDVSRSDLDQVMPLLGLTPILIAR